MKLDENLYEFYGVLLGDGCISKYLYRNRPRYEIRFDGNSLTDVDYYNRCLLNLISNIIDKRPKIGFRKQFNGIYVHFCNKNFALFLNETFGFPFGKKGNITIQNEILNDFDKLRHVLRGFFDTDGCLYFTKNNSKKRYYPIIELSSHSFDLLIQFKTALESVGFVVKISHYKDSIKLHGKKNLLKWMQIIGTNHPDKASKFSFWKKHGYCPKIDELSYRERLEQMDGPVAQPGWSADFSSSESVSLI